MRKICGGSEISIQCDLHMQRKSASMDCESAFFFTAKKGGYTTVEREVQRELETSLGGGKCRAKGHLAKSLHVHVYCVNCVVCAELHAMLIHVVVVIEAAVQCT